MSMSPLKYKTTTTTTTEKSEFCKYNAHTHGTQKHKENETTKQQGEPVVLVELFELALNFCVLLGSAQQTQDKTTTDRTEDNRGGKTATTTTTVRTRHRAVSWFRFDRRSFVVLSTRNSTKTIRMAMRTISRNERNKSKFRGRTTNYGTERRRKRNNTGNNQRRLPGTVSTALQRRERSESLNKRNNRLMKKNKTHQSITDSHRRGKKQKQAKPTKKCEDKTTKQTVAVVFNARAVNFRLRQLNNITQLSHRVQSERTGENQATQ